MRTASKVCAVLTMAAFLLSIFDLYAHPSHPPYANPGLWLELLFMCATVVFALVPTGSK